MNTIYIMPFTLLFIFFGGVYFIWLMYRKNLGNKIVRIITIIFVAVAGVFGAVYALDLVQTILGNTVKLSGECQTEFHSGDGEALVTYIRMDGETFTVQNNDFRDIKDGTYTCEVEATPIMYTVIEAKIEEK